MGEEGRGTSVDHREEGENGNGQKYNMSNEGKKEHMKIRKTNTSLEGNKNTQ
jgi:hypothetical protein